jgi:hypothetical protein
MPVSTEVVLAFATEAQKAKMAALIISFPVFIDRPHILGD